MLSVWAFDLTVTLSTLDTRPSCREIHRSSHHFSAFSPGSIWWKGAIVSEQTTLWIKNENTHHLKSLGCPTMVAVEKMSMGNTKTEMTSHNSAKLKGHGLWKTMYLVASISIAKGKAYAEWLTDGQVWECWDQSRALSFYSFLLRKAQGCACFPDSLKHLRIKCGSQITLSTQTEGFWIQCYLTGQQISEAAAIYF